MNKKGCKKQKKRSRRGKLESKRGAELINKVSYNIVFTLRFLGKNKSKYVSLAQDAGDELEEYNSEDDDDDIDSEEFIDMDLPAPMMGFSLTKKPSHY